MSEWALVDRRRGFKRVGIVQMSERELKRRWNCRIDRKSRRVEILSERTNG